MSDRSSNGTEAVTPTTVGAKLTESISVELSTRFLHHFSEQLYSSPQKAFEELISNGWDAGADYVDVRVSDDLSAPNATLCVLDNGVSMDFDGLRQLWHIAFSTKADKREEHGRKLIGKFGIGKLATYVLASSLTYICKASDGKIRRVTMDYGRIDENKDDAAGAADRLISDVVLPVYEVSEDDLEVALKNVDHGDVLLKLIRDGIIAPSDAAAEDEFESDAQSVKRASSATWTIAVLSNLKPAGRELKLGVLKRMLESALPFGTAMAICINGNRLASSKIDTPKMKSWRIGSDLGFDTLDVDDAGNLIDDDDESDSGESAPRPPDPSPSASPAAAAPATPRTKRPVKIKANSDSIEIPGIGKVTGRVTLFEDKVSGGKSDERGASNGFHVNVVGRVVNQSDASFGEKNLSHASWARFRMAVRADGLNPYLTTDREKFKDKPEMRLFRAFLRKSFNVARAFYDSDKNAEMPNGGDVLVASLGVLSLSPLRNVVSDALKSKAPVSGILDDSGIVDKKEKRRSWREDTADNINSALGQVKYEKVADNSFVKFRISDNTIVVNRDHPFVAEHSRTKAEKELLRTVAMVQLLSDIYALDIGVEPGALTAVRDYRDRLMRFRVMQQRQSGTHLANLLLRTQHSSDKSKLLEKSVSGALTYLGFDVEDLAKPGEPEGIARAYPTPTNSTATEEDPNPPLYSFTFDAKSSKHEVAATGNIKLDGIAEHRDRYKANYALVVAPGFSDGALATRCEQQKVTPITAHDLGRLLEYTVEHGAIPLTKLRELFQIHDPAKVTEWVTNLKPWLTKSRSLTIDVFLKALETLKGKVPDVLSASTIAYACRTDLKAVRVTNEDVLAVVKGLAILIPDLVGLDGERVIVNASSKHVAAAVHSQLEKLHDDGSTSADDASKTP